MAITAQDIAKLRAQTGAGMLDCKKALDETNGDFEKALDWLRERGVAKAAKRAGKIAAEGTVASYIHGGGSVGVLVEVNSETDFVAKNDGFQALVNDIALHIAAAAPKYVTRDEVPADVLEREKAIYVEQMKNEGKPADIIEKIVGGKIDKFYSEICLMEQPFIKDEDKTIEQLLTEKTGEIGEKITVRRFARFELGEGITKEKSDLAADVEEQLRNVA
ncbi:MAG TPA: elongation factor Ts [Candidatus Magasanikbacteria bacterium]|uniref:Elongation factor Ts n=1 Tax=Candidatus Magasanikbacteria bacterium GW2011_GWE2_42_7 TaxID=1619052 RepID=A0A0G1BH34_9BACT|nr:MAG: Elongation factor Ts [Candidatus Magasanikbacteria bacterium GW2011_GWC2_42_27]KKS72720.1 MAG: Elongation factor Ts [Candidatus Magasanikbacteria bacterium GW2011_GWE2_42_7]KKT24766.1 MAG: Elongation factor Ts [Candidatus Magasanikbacteria bacterium GW2011_GWA2_43_9]HBB38321.1 elongation factor Ts [Candidatus Magasanikbacteria bacterium]HCC13637.1 elongation factor Ts [Candidatus Magasanikbacteria bacterium]